MFFIMLQYIKDFQARETDRDLSSRRSIFRGRLPIIRVETLQWTGKDS
jgi:hypothetical protein